MKVWLVILMTMFSLSCLAQTNTTNVVSTPPASSQLASNIISMTQNKVSDQVILAYIQTQAQAQKEVKPVQVVKQFDPESYDFFYWNYLYPRTLRYRYQMLAPYGYGIQRRSH
jgi:hypothetical protein